MPDTTDVASAQQPAPDKQTDRPAKQAVPAPEGKMRAFHGCTYDDYRDHAMRDYPLPSRMILGFVVGVVWLLG